MPKKFQGMNSKAVEAKARKAQQVVEDKARKEKELEDAMWQDNDKHVNRKQQRKEEQERKRLENLNRKKELEELVKAEEASLNIKKTPTSSKVTRAEMDAARRREEQEKAEKARISQLTKKNISVQDDVMEENINKVLADNLSDPNAVEARSVEEAISVLSIQADVDKHPERRLKASYKKFEEQYLPVLKSENPSMRMSQLRQILKKEWQKSPENPLNQKHAAYNSK